MLSFRVFSCVACDMCGVLQSDGWCAGALLCGFGQDGIMCCGMVSCRCRWCGVVVLAWWWCGVVV